jgi:uncharacterized protein (DUF2236 family)
MKDEIDVSYDILYHVADRVKCVKTVDEARDIFKLRDYPFSDEVLQVVKPGMKTLTFALADVEFRGYCSVRSNPYQIGGFMWLKSIVRIK